jgi:hypothetical protein
MPTLSPPVQTPPPQVLYKAPQTDIGPQGLGGWLILVALGLIVSPIRIAAIEFTILGIFLDGTWSVLSDSSSEFYSPILAVIIPIEFVLNMAFIFGFLFLIYLFFTKSSIFPNWYMTIYAANLLVIILDMVAVKIALPDEPMMDPETTSELMRSIGACVVWIPYMLKSKRVAATFVE